MGQRELIILDTHAWIWHVAEDAQLRRRARSHIRRTAALGVHPVSAWEVAMLVNRRRRRLSMEVGRWIELALSAPRVRRLPCMACAAGRAAGFGDIFPGDPADRFIVAAALELSALLVTQDTVPTVWQ